MEIGFVQGMPVSVNGMEMDPVSLVELLNEIGARNAVGRIDLVENRFVGIKSRGCYETPGGTLLITAHRELEALCLERDVAHYKQHVGLKYAELVYFGLWFTPLREALDAFVNRRRETMTGTITLSLYKGNVSVVSRESEHSLYRTDLSSFTMDDSYDQKDAAGFIRILGLPSRSRASAPGRRSQDEDVVGADSGNRWILISSAGSGRFDFDRRLLRDELAASDAHARALERCRHPFAGRTDQHLAGLRQIREKRSGIAAISGGR